MDDLEITWDRVAKIWWLLMWRGTLGGVICGGIAGFLWGFSTAFTGLPVNPIAGIVGGLAGAAWYIVVTQMLLRKHYSDFRVALVPR